jgi:tetratricopeptide (TPR) repeat protein
MPADPYQAHLDRAASLFDAGDVVQAGQIWQAILKRDPANQAARAGLFRVKAALDQKNGAWDNERILQEGCTLFDMGQPADALQKWEQVLAHDPGHKLARAYANDARRELGLPPLAPARGGAQPAAQAFPAQAPPDLDQLVREGVQLYDLGMTEEAMVKWGRVLELRPEHKDALEYLRMARRDQAQAATPARDARPAPAPAPIPAENSFETQIWRAEQLLRERRLEEAGAAFQQLLDQGSQDPRVLHGYQQSRALLAARAPEPPSLPAQAAPARPAIQPVGPPRALTVRPPQRDGFRLPGALSGLRLPARLATPRNLMIAGGVAILVITGLTVYGLRRREAALREAVAVAKQNALRPVSRMVDIPQLTEPLEAVRAEAEQAMAEDPLLAYLRAQEWQRRDPDNSAATLLLQHAKDKLTFMQPTATLADYDRALQAGDLETARRAILSLLRHDPDDPDLRGRARKVLLALAPVYAGDERMGKAREALRLGRALFPQDLTWPAKLKLLEAIQDMAKPDRTPWLQLLG